MSEPEEPQRSRDEADIAEAQARMAAPAGPALSHDEFMALLAAEDRDRPEIPGAIP
ncbi:MULTISPECIES: hypothetical protein [unclassified Streptomyces]|uniref:hypothetical protein n=1 Tax=unclassified Streptomyces TaxID=2593676 RepID=UPI000B172CA9|nr:hypothetical protein [Streptomyces sp. LUP47B]